MRVLLLLVALGSGCGSVLSSTSDTAPTTSQAKDLAPGVRALRVQVAEEVAIVVEGKADSALSDHLTATTQAELGRLGISVVRAGDKSFDLTLRIEARVTGAMGYLRGRVRLSADKGGVTVAVASTDDELHHGSEFATVMTQKAIARLLGTSALTAFAEKVGPSRPVGHVRPSIASTQIRPTRSPMVEAKAHANRGTSLYNLGRFSEALAEYEAAYLAVQDPPFLFNIAQCRRKMGRYKEALESYRSYLRVDPDAPNRADVHRHIAELESQVHAAR